MADCASLPKCIFFNDMMASAPATANMLKQRLCHGNFTQCARFMVASAMGREKVPPDLYPNMVDRAKKLLASA